MILRLGGLAVSALAFALIAGAGLAAESSTPLSKGIASFGTYAAPALDAAKNQAAAWLKSAGKTDAATMQRFEAIWKGNRPLLDKVVRTLELGDPNAAALMRDARDLDAAAPRDVPSILKDTKVAPFLRNNLAIGYARILMTRKVYDEALEVLSHVKPEQTVDPSAFFFSKAVAEFTLMNKKEADETIAHLLDDVTDAPERYRMVGALMHLDMMTWRDKDLDWISRKMNIVRDRLEINRGGKKTQKIEREILVRLDEIIKEMENQQKKSSSSNGGSCPNGGPSQGGGPPQGNQASGSPATESGLPAGIAQGVADKKEDRKLVQEWGNLPEKERAAAQQDLSRRVPEKYQGAIQTYTRSISNKSGGQ